MPVGKWRQGCRSRCWSVVVRFGESAAESPSFRRKRRPGAFYGRWGNAGHRRVPQSIVSPVSLDGVASSEVRRRKRRYSGFGLLVSESGLRGGESRHGVSTFSAGGHVTSRPRY